MKSYDIREAWAAADAAQEELRLCQQDAIQLQAQLAEAERLLESVAPIAYAHWKEKYSKGAISPGAADSADETPGCDCTFESGCLNQAGRKCEKDDFMWPAETVPAASSAEVKP